jgi:RNA polymerase sigma-70 factor (ECF subfamily)
MAEDPDVLAARAGDREAFARLYRRFSRAVFLDLAARMRGRHEAEDALQATFLSAWTHLPRLRRPSRFVGWLFSIARNKARDWARDGARGGMPRMVLLGGSEELLAPRTDRPSDCDELRALVAGLRPKSRATLLLRAVEGWSAEEVAHAHGVSASTVRRRYADAIEHLRAGLEGSKTNDTTNRAARRVEL